jgi:hypothetical protein
MEFAVNIRSQGRAALIESTVRVLINELKLTKSRWKLYIITQRGLVKNEEMRGVVGPTPGYKNHLTMILDADLNTESLIDVLCHEMVHVKQFALGQAKIVVCGKKTTFFWKGKPINKIYWDCPWEHDAWRREKVLASRIYRIL